MEKYNSSHKRVLDEMLLNKPGVRSGLIFGYPAYYAAKKCCVCLYEGGVGIKVPEETATRLLAEDPNVRPFQPLGRRKMREWIQVDLDKSERYQDYLALFEESIEFVLSLQKE